MPETVTDDETWAIREQHALSEWELSQSLGATARTIFQWETGRASPEFWKSSSCATFWWGDLHASARALAQE
jgi:DNA-binding XRE family transcriptional regulator